MGSSHKAKLPKPKLPAVLAAKSAVRKSKSSKHLTPKERDIVARALVGEVGQEHPAMQSPLVQETIVEVLGSLGVDSKYLASHIKSGLEATKLFGKDAIPHDDWASRHRYLTTTLELAKIKLGGSGDPSNGSLHAHFHYQSRVRGDAESIDVSAPTNEKGRRRLVAAKPTNRKGL